MRTFECRKGRLAEQPIGHHVQMTYQSREWLGEVKAVRYDNGYYRLTVHHFNGEPWPFEPSLLSVNVID